MQAQHSPTTNTRERWGSQEAKLSDGLSHKMVKWSTDWIIKETKIHYGTCYFKKKKKGWWCLGSKPMPGNCQASTGPDQSLALFNKMLMSTIRNFRKLQEDENRDSTRLQGQWRLTRSSRHHVTFGKKKYENFLKTKQQSQLKNQEKLQNTAS